MSRRKKTQVKDPSEDEIWVVCSSANCGGEETAHIFLSKVVVTDGSPCGGYECMEKHYTVQCCGCKTLSFFKESSNSLDWYHDEYGAHAHIKRELFPSRIAGRKRLKESDILPRGVGLIYEETIQALANNQPILTGIGLRAIVEAVCKDRETASGNLYDRIEGLKDIGVLTDSAVQILHKIRLLGNDAAHEVEVNKIDDLIAAVEVVEHLLMTVYIIPYKADQIRAGGV